MVRYMVSINWTSFIRSTILTAFEAYGSALVGITPFEQAVDGFPQPGGAKLQSAHRG
jgi:hypothetical protein